MINRLFVVWNYQLAVSSFVSRLCGELLKNLKASLLLFFIMSVLSYLDCLFQVAIKVHVYYVINRYILLSKNIVILKNTEVVFVRLKSSEIGDEQM